MILLKIILLIIIAASVALDATSDAIIDKTKKRNHPIETLTIGCFLAVIFLHKYLDYNEIIIIFVYILMRIGLFNLTYNIVRKLSPFYRGTSSKYDVWMNRIPTYIYGFFTIISLIVLILIYLKYGFMGRI